MLDTYLLLCAVTTGGQLTKEEVFFSIQFIRDLLFNLTVNKPIYLINNIMITYNNLSIIIIINTLSIINDDDLTICQLDIVNLHYF